VSRTKKSRKPGKLAIFLPTGPSKTELLADPGSREARRKQALAKKRHQQRSVKKDEGTQQNTGEGADGRKRQPRLKAAPEQVAALSRELLNAGKEGDDDQA